MGEDIAGGPLELGRGALIGRYIVLGLLGKGGMGEVYAAYDPELDRKVAVKLLRSRTTAGVDASEGRSRMVREAQALAQLSDPNVVAVYDVGTVGDRVFLAMEFVDGNTLSFWLHAAPRTWREIVDCYAAAGRGLAAAHRSDLVHRDFKPENVMVGRDGQVRVMDFGLARSLGTPPPETSSAEKASGSTAAARSGAGPATPAGRATGGPATPAERASFGHSQPTRDMTAAVTPVPAATKGAVSVSGWNDAELETRDFAKPTLGNLAPSAVNALSSPLTVTGAMMGTPAYMAPEQFAGQIADTRSDQFSFCVALYEALYGERPFAGRNLNDLTANVLAGRVRETPAQTRVPSWLRKVLLRGLRVDRAERYESMEAVLAALERDPARARRRWTLAASVVGLIAALTGGLIQASQQQKIRCAGAPAKLAGVWELPSAAGLSPRKEAIRRAFMATGKRYAADAFALVTGALDHYVVTWNDMHRDACEATYVRGEQSADVLDLRMSCLQDRFSEVRALTAVFSDANGDVVGKAAEAVQGLRPVEQCADIVALKAVVRPPDDPLVRRAVADVRTDLADVKALTNAGRYKQSSQKIPQIINAARATKYQPVVAEALFQLAQMQELTGRIVEAGRNYEEAVWDAEGSRYDEVAAMGAAQLVAVVGYSQNRPEDGERWARFADAVLHRLGPGHEIVAAWRLNNLAMVYELEGRPEAALKMFSEALEKKTAALGREHYDVALSMDNIAFLLGQLGRIDEAIEKNHRALEILLKTVGPEHPLTASCLSNGAEFMNTRGRYAEAEAMAQRALAICQQELDKNHPYLASPLTAIGTSWLERGQPSRALPFFERALAIREGKDPEPSRMGELRFALARAMTESNGASDRSVFLAKQARADYQQSNSGKKKVADIDDWLARQRQRPVHVSMR